MSVLESMVLGTPVVGGVSSGNIPYLLAHGDAGVLCDVDDPYAVADASRRLLDDPRFAQDLSAKARARAGRHFSERLAVTGYTDYFSDILGASA